MAEEVDISQVPALDLSSAGHPKLALTCDIVKYFPGGMTPFNHQELCMEEGNLFTAAPAERVMMIYISTAGGKTPLAIAFSRAWIAAGGRAAIVCPNKELQGQIEKDCGAGELSVVVGASDFSCSSVPGASCGSMAARKNCPSRRMKRAKEEEDTLGCASCPYRRRQLAARQAAGSVPLCFTPHSLLAYRGNEFLSRSLPDGDGLLVVDEAHMLPDQLVDMLSFSLRVDIIEEILSAARKIKAEKEAGEGGPSTLGLASSSDGRDGARYLGHVTPQIQQDAVAATALAEGPISGPSVEEPAEKATLSAKELETLASPPSVPLAPAAALKKSEASFEFTFFGPRAKRRGNHEGLALSTLQKRQQGVLGRLLECLTLCSEEAVQLCEEKNFEKLQTLFPQFADNASDESHWLKIIDFLQASEKGLMTILTMAEETDWACELTAGAGRGGDDPVARDKWKSPIRLLIRPGVIPPSFLKQFFSGFSKVILMSGTLFQNHLERLGLVSKDSFTEEGKILGVRRFEASSRISPSRRKMYIDKVHGESVRHGNIDKPFARFARFITSEVTPHLPGQKGFIHVSSSGQAEKLAFLGNQAALALAKEAQEAGVGDGRPMSVFMTAKSRGWKASFGDFRKAPVGGSYGENLYFVAARRYEGIDLKDDLARINIIAKVPHPNIKDSIVCSLNEVFGSYSLVATLTSFIQAANRAVRHPNDWALNICLDTSIMNIFLKFGQDLPEYIKEAFEEQEDPHWLSSWSPPEAEEPRKLLTGRRKR